MSAPALAGVGHPTVTFRGTAYPLLLPRLTDPRLHLAAVITSLQVLGQVAFDFELSIAQILVSLLTCAVLEVAIVLRRRRVVMWPASALLTGNGIAFILRVPGTEHGDWWSMRGWWIYAGTAAFALLSKHLVQVGGTHIFNPSNLALVLCFLLLGPELADPLALWWGPMSLWMALALAIIVGGGLAILSRLGLLVMAATFWAVFAAGIGVLALSGHEMLARWHLGPITGVEFWRVLVFSPEVLIFLFFMITDPRTIPSGRRGRVAFAMGVALLAVLLIAPQTTEFATKVALLGALTLACASRPLLAVLAARAGDRRRSRLRRSRLALGGLATAGAVGFTGVLVLAGIPARPSSAEAGVSDASAIVLPPIEIARSEGLAAGLDRTTAERIARDLLAALRVESEAIRDGDRERATAGATGAWLATVWQRIDEGAGGGTAEVAAYTPDRIRIALSPGEGQGQPVVLATLIGTVTTEIVEPGTARVVSRSAPTPVERTFHLLPQGGRYVVARVEGAVSGGAGPVAGGALASVRLVDVAATVGLDVHHDAFRLGMSGDPAAMMGGGLCWLDYDADGWTDLFVVNAYAESDRGSPTGRDLARSRLFRNDGGRFHDVTDAAGIDLRLKGTGCVAADLDLDGRPDLVVTTAAYDPARDAFDALLWNDGDGTFTEGAKTAGISEPGWHAGATVGDVDGNGRPDLFVAGYTDVNAPIPGSGDGFPTDHLAVRDLLYLNVGRGADGRARFREVGRAAGIESAGVRHGLGAVFTDVDLDGRLDLLVANDEDPNSLYVNVPWSGGADADPAGLGFRLEDRAGALGVADENAGMGVAVADGNEDGRPDLVVTNSRDQLHAAAWSDGDGFTDARPDLAPALSRSSTGWGAAWVDVDNDSHLDLVVANGAIPVTSLRRDAERVQVLQSGAGAGTAGRFADASALVGIPATPRVNGRGLATADFDNDGDLDLAVNAIGGRLLLLRNDGATGHWLAVRLVELGPGTRVTTVLDDGRRLVREAQAGGSYLSSHDSRLHFGLGEAERVAELVVRRPDGRETTLEDVAADRVVDVGP